jgi:hypothetical protein
MADQDTLAAYSNALQELAEKFYGASEEASKRIMSNLRIDALRTEASLTERFWAYLEMGLDQQLVGDQLPMKLTAIAFTDRGDEPDEVNIGADMACFIRYDLPGLRWAKGFIGHSKLAYVKGWRNDHTIPIIGLGSEGEYDRMIQQCAAMGNITDESYVFFYSSESVTVEKASNLLGDLGETYPDKPWADLHQFRSARPVDAGRFYGGFAACHLGEPMLDTPTRDYGTVLDLIKQRRIQTVLLLMVGTTVPQRPLRRDSPELDALTAPVPETYWLWNDLLQTLINR